MTVIDSSLSFQGKKVPEVLVACAPSLGVMKGLKDLAKMEALFFSGSTLQHE